MCPIWRGSIKHRCHQSEHHQAFPWLNKNYHDSSKIYVFHVTKSFHSPWNTKLESYQYTASVAIPNCIKALALLSFCLGMQNQEGVCVCEWVSEWVRWPGTSPAGCFLTESTRQTDCFCQSASWAPGRPAFAYVNSGCHIYSNNINYFITIKWWWN
jgi:hypothetical protein